MDRFRLKIDFSVRFRSVFGRLNEGHFWGQGRTTLKLTENHRTRLVNVLGGATVFKSYADFFDSFEEQSLNELVLIGVFRNFDICNS